MAQPPGAATPARLPRVVTRAAVVPAAGIAGTGASLHTAAASLHTTAASLHTAAASVHRGLASLHRGLASLHTGLASLHTPRAALRAISDGHPHRSTTHHPGPQPPLCLLSLLLRSVRCR